MTTTKKPSAPWAPSKEEAAEYLLRVVSHMDVLAEESSQQNRERLVARYKPVLSMIAECLAGTRRWRKSRHKFTVHQHIWLLAAAKLISKRPDQSIGDQLDDSAPIVARKLGWNGADAHERARALLVEYRKLGRKLGK